MAVSVGKSWVVVFVIIVQEFYEHSLLAFVVVRMFNMTSLAQVNFVSVVSRIQVQPSGDFIRNKGITECHNDMRNASSAARYVDVQKMSAVFYDYIVITRLRLHVNAIWDFPLTPMFFLKSRSRKDPTILVPTLLCAAPEKLC